MAKVAKFDTKDDKFAEILTAFLQVSDIVDNGLFTLEDQVVIMYRDKEDLGATKAGLLIELSKRLTKSTELALVQKLDMADLDYRIESYKGSEDAKAGLLDEREAMVESQAYTQAKIKNILDMIASVKSDEFVIPKAPKHD